MHALPRPLRWPVLFALSLIMITCTAGATTKGGVVRVTPGPATGNDGGNVRVRYHGTKQFLQLTALTWKDGRWTPSAGATGPVSVPVDHEVSIQLNDPVSASADGRYQGIVLDRAIDRVQTIPFEAEKASSPDQHAQPLRLSSLLEAREDEPVTVWGYAVCEGDLVPPTDEPIEQQAEKAAYAVIVTVQMLDRPVKVPPAQSDIASAWPGTDGAGSGDRTAPVVAADADGRSRFDAIW